MRKWFGSVSLVSVSVSVMYLGLLFYPNPLFAHQLTYKNVHVYSDRVIPADAMEDVLDDALSRLARSELYREERRFHVYFANDNWRFTLFTRNPNAGGVVNLALNGNVFIRASDIGANKIFPPSGWMYDEDERPLSYFLAHEMTHAMQRDLGGLWLLLTKDRALVEGYADYIGKAPHFDFERYREMYLHDGFSEQSNRGLYHREHMYMAMLLDRMTYLQALKLAPDIEETLQQLAPQLSGPCGPTRSDRFCRSAPCNEATPCLTPSTSKAPGTLVPPSAETKDADASLGSQP